MRADKALFIKNADGGFVDAATGSAAGRARRRAEAGSRQQRRARCDRCGTGRVAAVLARCLRPDSPPRKLCSGHAIRRPCPRWIARWRRKPIPGVQTPIEQARAAAMLASPDATEADRLDAVATSCARGDIEARSTLGNLTGQSPAVAAAAAGRDHRHRSQPATLVGAAERLLRSQPGLRSAAGRRRAGDHLRRHGRHQHGAWRDGDDRRLCHLHGAAGNQGVSARDLSGQYIVRHSAGLHRRRR